MPNKKPLAWSLLQTSGFSLLGRPHWTTEDGCRATRKSDRRYGSGELSDFGIRSSQDVGHNLAVDVGQAEIASLSPVGQLLVVDA